MKNILVAVDFSDDSDELMRTAAQYGKALSGYLRVLYVDSSAPYAFSPPDPNEIPANISQQADPSANAVMDHFRRRLTAAGVATEFRKLEGPAAIAILLAADEFDADLIIMGGHRHSHLYRCIYGNRTESVIRKAGCPVLVVPPQKRRQRRAAPVGGPTLHCR